MSRIKKPFIRPILNASTAHITKRDNDLLEKADNPLAPYRYEFGYFIHIWYSKKENDVNFDAAKAYGHSRNLIRLIKEARSLKCHFLQLDCDGETYPEFETFDW